MASVRSEALALDYGAKAMGVTAHALQAAMKYRRKNHLNVVHRVSSDGSPSFIPKRDEHHGGTAPPFGGLFGTRSIVWRFVMLKRERPRGVRLGVELEADALLSISGAQAYSIALKRAEEASSEEMARDWSVVASTVARKSGVRSSLLDALFG
jgi:hypothetical protein